MYADECSGGPDKQKVTDFKEDTGSKFGESVCLCVAQNCAHYFPALLANLYTDCYLVPQFTVNNAHPTPGDRRHANNEDT